MANVTNDSEYTDIRMMGIGQTFGNGSPATRSVIRAGMESGRTRTIQGRKLAKRLLMPNMLAMATPMAMPNTGPRVSKKAPNISVNAR